MDELTLLANALMALDDKLAACMKCGMCQSVCPVFGETMMEADVTRGKLTLLENWLTVSLRTRTRSTKTQSLPPVRLLSGELPFRRFHSGNLHGGPRHRCGL